jgi:hypothetical protein
LASRLLHYLVQKLRVCTGVLLGHFRPALLLLAVALFSASAWADGIDPKVIIQGGTGSIPITLTNPNPSFGPLTATTGTSSNGTPCLGTSDACVSQVFQNQTGQTIHNLTIAINDLKGFSFQCGDLSQILFFSNCSSSDNGSVTDVSFSGGSGIVAATQQCVADSLIDVGLSLAGANWCKKLDPDDFKFVGGEFGLLIDATEAGFAGKSGSGTTLTTPEPDVGILMLSAAFAFGLLKLLRRGA